MTDNLTAELARLNAFVKYGYVSGSDVLALANKLHAENERLRALLVEAEKLICAALRKVESWKTGHSMLPLFDCLTEAKHLMQPFTEVNQKQENE